MPITRNDIINKVFTRIVLGYDDAEVDAFLDEIMTEVELLEDKLVSAIQDNEKFKIQVNRLNEESTRIASSRQETNRLREENAKLQAELVNFRKQFEDIERDKAQREETVKQVSTMINEARVRSQEILREAEEKARDLLGSAEREGSDLVRKAKESANQIARDVQDRERQIIDKAQQRARIILESAKEKAEEKTSPLPNYRGVNNPSSNSGSADFSDDAWPGWLDKP